MTPLPIGTNNMDEAHSFLLGLILVKKGDFHQGQIQGDSHVIISCCIKRQSSSWKLKDVLQQIQNIIDQFQEVKVSCTYREGNRVVDYLSNLRCNGIITFTLNTSTFMEHYKDLQKLMATDQQKSNTIYMSSQKSYRFQVTSGVEHVTCSNWSICAKSQLMPRKLVTLGAEVLHMLSDLYVSCHC